MSPAHSRPPKHKARGHGISKERAQRLRIAWYILGLISGMAVTTLFHQHFEPAEEAFDEPTEDSSPPSDTTTSGGDNHSDAMPQGAPIPTAEQPWPRQVEVTVSSGDTLLDLLTEQGLTYQSASEVMHELKSTFDPRGLKPQNTVTMVLSHDDSRAEKDAALLSTMSIVLSDIEQVNLKQVRDGSYEAERTRKKVQVVTDYRESRITSSLSATAERIGIPQYAVDQLIKNYSYDVDFQRDIQPGDTIKVLYEKCATEDNIPVQCDKNRANVLYASLHTSGKERAIYRFGGSDGGSRFYNEKGESIIKKLLRTPIDGARISSGFGMRFHPVLGYSRMHRGIDFAAPIGTPIFAAGDGVVEFVGQSNGYGNFVKVKHNATWESAYGHISRFASGLHKGKQVHQGDVIAYVGMTGMATGPHLHYELIKFGSQINPSGVQFAGGDKLEGRDFAAFKTNQKKVMSDIARLEKPRGNEVAGIR